MKDQTGKIIDLINDKTNEKNSKSRTQKKSDLNTSIKGKIVISGNNVNIVNSFNQTDTPPKVTPTPRNNMHITFIENELEERGKTIEKLTLWVLDIELNTLDGLTEFELLKLRNFLINDN